MSLTAVKSLLDSKRGCCKSMKVAIIGAGIVGLALANELISTFTEIYIDIFDSYSIPSKGTSLHNSGVLHAGLYYLPASLKSKFCSEGRSLLKDYMRRNGIPLLQCGKLLVPHSESDVIRMHAIKERADLNGCETEIVSHGKASSIQPGICVRDEYLWSPKTSVFSPADILDKLVCDLKSSDQVEFIVSPVQRINADRTSLCIPDQKWLNYDFIYNVCGPGSLSLFRQITNSLDHLFLVPFLGEYARIRKAPEIKTNIYPVPDTKLPFLGIHLTPQLNNLRPIVGPNAKPFLRSYLDQYIRDDFTDLHSRLLVLLGLYASNSDGFREHAHTEFSVSTKNRFLIKSSQFFLPSLSSYIALDMDASSYGIRPQLVDLHKLNFVNDFICETTNKVINVINAISPAFTSSMAMAKYLTAKVLAV